MAEDKPHPFTSSPQQWRKLKPRAREMRHDPTPAEDCLWQRIRNRQIQGAKFRRQHTIDGFIVDFVCIEAKLVIEVEGHINNNIDQLARDLERQAMLETKGFRVVQFSNHAVLHATDAVLQVINAILTDGPQ